MQYFRKPHLLFALVLSMALVLGVACGTSAPAEQPAAPASSGSSAPAASSSSDSGSGSATGSAAPAASSGSSASSGSAASSGAAPVAAPQPTAMPAMESTEVNPGKVVWMVGSFANERMTYCLAGGGGHDYGRQIHAFLIDSKIDGSARVLTPGIAEKWEVTPDGRSWTVTVRDGIKFNDGSDLTTEDVRWTLQWAVGEQAQEYSTGGGCLSQSQLTESIEQTAPNQVTVTYKDTYATFEDAYSQSTGTWIGTIYPAGLGGGNPEVIHDEEVELAYDRNPVGAGQMRLVRHVASDLMEFERFDDHYYHPDNGLPEDRRTKFQTLELRLVPEQATRVAALRAGDADIAPISLGAKGQVESGGGRVLFGQEGAFFFARLLGCWEAHLPCHDIRVRQALNYAVDRASMRDKLFGGPEVFQPKGFPNVTPSTIGYTPELDPWEFNPEKARELMVEAGYSVPGAEGGKEFGKLLINTWPSASVPNMPDAAQFVAEVWQEELGIDAEVTVSEESAIKKLTRLTEDAYGQVLFRDNETRLDGSSMLNGGYGRNPDRPDRSSRDPDVVGLAKEIRVIVEPNERTRRVSEFYLRARDESNELMMGYVNIPWGVGPRIATWEPYPLAFYVNSIHTITLK